jgi:hypothetical protein
MPQGARYEIVGRVLEDEVAGTYLDVGETVAAPAAYTTWPKGTIIRFRSGLHGCEALSSEPPDPWVTSWYVRGLFVRYVRSVPDVDPNSYRPDWTDVRFREIEQMRMWSDERNPSMTCGEALTTC